MVVVWRCGWEPWRWRTCSLPRRYDDVCVVRVHRRHLHQRRETLRLWFCQPPRRSAECPGTSCGVFLNGVFGSNVIRWTTEWEIPIAPTLNSRNTRSKSWRREWLLKNKTKPFENLPLGSRQRDRLWDRVGWALVATVPPQQRRRIGVRVQHSPSPSSSFFFSSSSSSFWKYHL